MVRRGGSSSGRSCTSRTSRKGGTPDELMPLHASDDMGADKDDEGKVGVAGSVRPLSDSHHSYGSVMSSAGPSSSSLKTSQEEAFGRASMPGWLKHLLVSKDWWSVWISLIMFVPVLAVTLNAHMDSLTPENWTSNPARAWVSSTQIVGFIIIALWAILALVFGMTTIKWLTRHGRSSDAPPLSIPAVAGQHAAAISVVSLIGLVARWLGEQASIDQYGITFEVWGLIFGMLISNLRLIPKWLEPGKEGEFFIKVGLVLLGLDLRSVAALGGPGLLSSWVPTPIVIIGSTAFAFYVLRMRSERALVLILVCGTCICGSSAATAIFGCTGGDTEVLTLCIAIINLFTIPQMIGIPYLAYYAGLQLKVAAAWLGASIDATGAVVAAASVLDQLADKDCSIDDTCAVDVASTVKIVQNILIGPVAVVVSLYWIRTTERERQQRERERRKNGSTGTDMPSLGLSNASNTSSNGHQHEQPHQNSVSLTPLSGTGAREQPSTATTPLGEELSTAAGGVGAAVEGGTHVKGARGKRTNSSALENGVEGGHGAAMGGHGGSDSNDGDTDQEEEHEGDVAEAGKGKGKPHIAKQLWDKFPKFVLGFLFCSTIITVVNATVGEDREASLKVGMQAVSKWFFCLGFVGIGLSSDLRKLASKMQGGKPIMLYVVCQLFDLLLKFGFAQLSFGVIQRD